MEAFETKFEGPEKKLEIILDPARGLLRSWNLESWRRVVTAGGADIISRISNSRMDAYLLSESSLFVWKDRMLMITCGQTRPVRALDEILTRIDAAAVNYLFYERKNLFFPKEQPASFEEDATALSRIFPGKHLLFGAPDGDHLHLYCYAATAEPRPGDVTLQVLMHDLAPATAGRFSGRGRTAAEVTRSSGIESLYPDAQTDAYLFAPVGYSVNGIQGGDYFTIHVTPQSECSYASFETTISDRSISGLLRQIIEIFDPSRFSLILTAPDREGDAILPTGRLPASPPKGYHPVEHSRRQLTGGYAAAFLNYRRFPEEREKEEAEEEEREKWRSGCRR